MIRTLARALWAPLASVTILVMVASAAEAQWDPYPWKNVPRTADGKVDLNAPARRMADGKPDLSGVWMHEPTSVAEVRRLFGNRLDEDILTSVPGMEIGTQHKYAFNILLDFKPDEAPMQLTVADLRKAFEVATTITRPGIYFTGSVFLCNQTRGTTTIDRNPYTYSQ